MLRLCSARDPYCLLFGPDNADCPGMYLVRVIVAVPGDEATGHCWAADSLERARAMIPAGLTRWPKVRTAPRPGLLEQWCLRR